MKYTIDDKDEPWLEIAGRKSRRSGRALRFGELQVGDQLQREWKKCEGNSVVVWYYMVTDLWFDPVAGQKDEIAGKMVGIQKIDERTGELHMRKHQYTLRGLASNGFFYAEIDYVEHVKTVRAALEDGDIVGIGFAHVIRRRPKVPTSRF